MKKNLIALNGILLLFLLMFSSCRKENANTLVSDQANASKLTSSSDLNSKLRSSKVALTETQILIRKWVEWVFTRDVSLIPWDDATGEKQYAGQPYAEGTMMLAGGGSPDLTRREITIDIDQYQYVFIPVVNVMNRTNECYQEHPTNGNVPNGSLSAPIKEALNGKRTLILNWDGNSLLPDNLKDLRDNSGFWEFPVHSSWDEGCTASSGTFYADGFWVKIPLTVGVHTLEVGGNLDFRRFKFEFSNHVIYTINVTN
jgi:hypothetical protein